MPLSTSAVERQLSNCFASSLRLALGSDAHTHTLLILPLSLALIFIRIRRLGGRENIPKSVDLALQRCFCRKQRPVDGEKSSAQSKAHQFRSFRFVPGTMVDLVNASG